MQNSYAAFAHLGYDCYLKTTSRVALRHRRISEALFFTRRSAPSPNNLHIAAAIVSLYDLPHLFPYQSFLSLTLDGCTPQTINLGDYLR